MKMNAEIERSYFMEKWQEIGHNGKGLELKMSAGGVPQDDGVQGDYCEVPQDLHLGEKLVYAFYVYFMYQKHSFGT